jgi:hypothetical protein
MILLISASWVARITGVSHWHPAQFYFYLVLQWLWYFWYQDNKGWKMEKSFLPSDSLTPFTTQKWWCKVPEPRTVWACASLPGSKDGHQPALVLATVFLRLFSESGVGRGWRVRLGKGLGVRAVSPCFCHRNVKVSTRL